MIKSSDTKNFTRGGQITLHNIRMFFQIMDKVTWISIGIFLIATFCISWTVVTSYERYVFSEYMCSAVMPILDSSAATDFTQPNGSVTSVKYTDINESAMVKEIVRIVGIKLLRAIMIGLFISIFSGYGISQWLKKRGLSQTEDIPVKGDTILSKEATRDLITKQKINSDLTLAGLPLIKDKETSHFLFHGTVGSGKSTAIKELLDQIRGRGERAIIYDKGCDFMEEFFLPDHDILLNPMDNRGEAWDLWQECRDSADFDNLAAAQIPMPLSTADPFWINAAKTIFSAAAFEMRKDSDRSVLKLLKYLLTADLDVLQTYLKGTVAETLVSEKIEKTAISIKSVLATYLKSMKYIKEGKSAFSIRQWVQNDAGSNWLFITSLGDKHETLKPLITSWLDIAINTLLSLPKDYNRRIWIILDEVTSLQQLPYLTQTLAESRKFGGCAILGLQNISQLSKLYGQDGAREISSLINTRAMFRQPDPDVAKWSALNFGETITDEVREGLSYGANTMRDGISINRVETTKAVINFSEVMSLGDLQAFLRLPGKFPITSIDFQYKARKKLNNGFVLRHFDETKMHEVNDLIDKFSKPTAQKSEATKVNRSTTKESVFDSELIVDI
jgi:type IV conjugative transfer system coupling protein TraD